MPDSRKWIVRGERVVDDTPHVRVSLADIELPNRVRFTQYVFRMRQCAMAVVLDEPGERVLLMRRHRFVVDRWVWELPGGYIDDGEDAVAAAAREVEEETGWRPHGLEHVLSCQPMIGNADYPQELFAGRGAERTGVPDPDETAEVRWIPLDEAQGDDQHRRDLWRDHRDRGEARPAAAGRRSATSAVKSRTAGTSARVPSRRTRSRT